MPLQGSAKGGVGVTERLETYLKAVEAEYIGKSELAGKNDPLHGTDKMIR